MTNFVIYNGEATGHTFSSLTSSSSTKSVVAEFAAGNIQFLEYQVKVDSLFLGAAPRERGPWATVECCKLPLNCFVKDIVWSNIGGGLATDDGDDISSLVDTGAMLSNTSASHYVLLQTGPSVWSVSGIHSYPYQFNRILTPFTKTIAKDIPFCDREDAANAPRYVNMSFRTKPAVAATKISGTFKVLVTILQGDTQNEVDDGYPTGGISSGSLL
tara:strand:- start:151 stop:795 length:645 start_codon:yes stop_codon:yes gene_type:complete